MKNSSLGGGQSSPSAPSFERRKRRHPGAVSIHAILLLFACGNSFRFGNGGAVALVPHLPTSPRPQRRTQPSRIASGLALPATATDESTPPRIKGGIARTPQPKKRRSKQKSYRRSKYKSRNRTASSAGPWNASYETSVQTQRRIQSAARVPGSDPITVARSVLITLLESPPEECNAANLVCALTLSSKTLSRRRRGAPSSAKDEGAFRGSLVQTISILRTLLEERRLSPRQLCNAAWAVAKHVERDPSLFSRGRRNDNVIIVKDSSTWDLSQNHIQDGQEGETEMLVDDVFNSIAERVTDHLEETRSGASGVGKKIQAGELSMLLWAYAVVKPRDRPPGWEKPRQAERLAKDEKVNLKSSESGPNSVDFMTFTNFGGGGSSSISANTLDDTQHYSRYQRPEHQSSTDKLFDAAAIAFCQGEGASAKKEANTTTLLRECTWNELSNIAWSFATRGACCTRESEAMLSFFAREATRRLGVCEDNWESEECDILPRDAVQIAWALGTMESDNVSVGDGLVRLVDGMHDYWIDAWQGERPLTDWTCEDLVQMATALAHGRLDNQAMLGAVFEEALERLEYRNDGPRHQRIFTTAEVSILLWVQARMYLTPKYGAVYQEFPRVASRALLQRMKGRNFDESLNMEEGDGIFPAEIMLQKGLRPQEQANLAWSLTILENYDDHVVSLLQNIFHAASSSAASDDDDGLIQLEHAHQLWQSYFLLSQDCPKAVKHVPAEFGSYLEEKWNAEKGRRKRSSSRHAVISKTLDLMRVAHRNEYDEDVDVAIVLEGDSSWTRAAVRPDGGDDEGRVKVAMEFDGPHHFTVIASTGEDLAAIDAGEKMTPRVLGHTVLKYRLLKRKGWTVVRIPYYEFDKIPFWASMERQRYLQRALKTHDKIVFSDVDVSEYKELPATRLSRFD